MTQKTNIAMIWVEIKLLSIKNILNMGGYRQQRLLKELGIEGSNKSKSQIERFNIISQKWEKAIRENKEVIVVMVTNIDTLTNSRHNKNNKITPLHNMLQQHINMYNIHNIITDQHTFLYTNPIVVLTIFSQTYQTK